MTLSEVMVTVVDSINHNNALPMEKSVTIVTNTFTFTICVAVVTNAPSPDSLTNPNLMISHKP